MFGHRSGRLRYFVRWFFNVQPEWCDSQNPVVETKKERVYDEPFVTRPYKVSRKNSVSTPKIAKRRKD